MAPTPGSLVVCSVATARIPVRESGRERSASFVVDYGPRRLRSSQRANAPHSDSQGHGSQALEYGTAWINEHCTLPSEVPFGGVKGSGYRHDVSMCDLEEYTSIKHVMIDTRR